MTALPQIFAPQPAPQAAVSRPSTPEASAPLSTERVESRNSDKGEKRSDSQSMDRRFDEAMSEAQADKEPAKSSKDLAGNKTPTAQRETAAARDVANKDEPAVSGNQGSEANSDVLFSSLISANGTASNESTENAVETQKAETSIPVASNTAPVTVAPSDAVETPPAKTSTLQQDAAIDAPLPAEITIPTTEGDASRQQAPVGDNTSPMDASSQTVKPPADTDTVQANTRAAIDPALISEEATPQPETGDVKRNADAPAVPTTELAESGTELTNDRRVISDQPKLQTESGNIPATDAAIDQSAEAQPKTARADVVTAQSDVGLVVDDANQTTDVVAEGPKQTADKSTAAPTTDTTQAISPRVDGSEDVKSAAQARADRIDADAIRSDRPYAAPSATDIIPDADRLMPLTSKPVSLAALADTVSLPGLSQAIPASTPLSPMIGSISGLSERLAATLLQNAQANPTVTLDKIPQAVVTVALSSRSATIQIDPPELGRIQLDYQFDSQGRTVVTLTPESEAARAALVDRMATITAALEQGSSSGVDVKLGDTQDFGTAFSEASDGDAGEDSSTGSENGSGERSPSEMDTVLAQRGHHIAEDGTSRLHMRV